MDTLTDEEIKKILASGSFNELAMLPLSVGMHHANWKIAQTLCVKLAGHTDERIRANAILGLAYIAMTKGKLEKHIVKPLLLRELRTNVEYKWRIIDSINDINQFLNWKIVVKPLHNEP